MSSERSWPVVVAGFVTMFVAFGTMYSFGIFFNPIAEEFSSSRAAVSGIGGLTTATFLLLGAAAGPVADRLGTRPVLIAGGVLLGGGLIGASRAQAIWQLYATQGFVVGLGIACSYVASIAAVARHVSPRRRALSIGIVVAGTGVGTVAYAPVGRRLIEAFGFRGALAVFGGFGAAALAGAALRLHGRTLDRPTGTPVSVALRDRSFRLIWFAGLFSSFAFLIPVVHVVPYARDHGMSALFGSFLLAAIGGSSTVGRFALAGVAGRLGVQRAFASAPLGMAVSFAIWLFADQPVPLVLFAIVYGTFQGGFVALLPSITADYFGTANLAGIIGVLNTCAAAGSLAGPPAAGAFYDAFGTYTVPILGGVAVNLVGFALLTRLDPVGATRRPPEGLPSARSPTDA